MLSDNTASDHLTRGSLCHIYSNISNYLDVDDYVVNLTILTPLEGKYFFTRKIYRAFEVT
jgi:hypothetical protein